jgi:hypothetical protein
MSEIGVSRESNAGGRQTTDSLHRLRRLWWLGAAVLLGFSLIYIGIVDDWGGAPGPRAIVLLAAAAAIGGAALRWQQPSMISNVLMLLAAAVAIVMTFWFIPNLVLGLLVAVMAVVDLVISRRRAHRVSQA